MGKNIKLALDLEKLKTFTQTCEAIIECSYLLD